MTVPPGDSTDDEFAVESVPTHTENSRGSACVGVTPRGRQLLPWAGVVKRKVVLIYESNIRTRMKSKSKVPEYEGTTEVRNGVQTGVQGRSCARQGKENLGNVSYKNRGHVSYG